MKNVQSGKKHGMKTRSRGNIHFCEVNEEKLAKQKQLRTRKRTEDDTSDIKNRGSLREVLKVEKRKNKYCNNSNGFMMNGRSSFMKWWH